MQEQGGHKTEAGSMLQTPETGPRAPGGKSNRRQRGVWTQQAVSATGEHPAPAQGPPGRRPCTEKLQEARGQQRQEQLQMDEAEGKEELGSSVQFSSVQSLSCVQLCDPMNRSMPGLPVHHQLTEFTQTHIH